MWALSTMETVAVLKLVTIYTMILFTKVKKIIKTVLSALNFLTVSTSVDIPGPLCLPFVGSCYVLGNDIVKSIHRISKYYGGIFTVYIFRNPCIFVNDSEILREVYMDKRFLSRPVFGVLGEHVGEASLANNGVLMSNDETWRAHRILLHSFIRSKQNAGKGLKSTCVEVAHDLVTTMESKDDYFNPIKIFASSFLDMQSRFMFGDNHTLVKSQLTIVTKAISDLLECQKASAVYPLLLESYPFLGKMKIKGVEKLIKSTQTIFHEVTNLLTLSEQQKISLDLVDFYCEAKHKELKSDNENQCFTLKNLKWFIVDLYVAGHDALLTGFIVTIRFLLKYPQYQEKIFEETSSTESSSEQECPFTYAFIKEAIRILPPAPIGIPRKTSCDVVLSNGMKIPKDVMLIGNIYGAHRDEKIWKDPETFDPERFLTEENVLMKNQYFFGFSSGRRNCPGAGHAKFILFHIVSTILKKYKLVGDVGNGDIIKKFGCEAIAADFNMKIIPR